MYSDVESNLDILALALEGLETFRSVTESQNVEERWKGRTKTLSALITVASVLVGVFAWREVRAAQCTFSLDVYSLSPLTV